MLGHRRHGRLHLSPRPSPPPRRTPPPRLAQNLLSPCACAGAFSEPVAPARAATPSEPRTNRIQSRERSGPPARESERSRRGFRQRPFLLFHSGIPRANGPKSRFPLALARTHAWGLTPPSRPELPQLSTTSPPVDGGVCPLRRKRQLGPPSPSRARPHAPPQLSPPPRRTPPPRLAQNLLSPVPVQGFFRTRCRRSCGYAFGAASEAGRRPARASGPGADFASAHFCSFIQAFPERTVPNPAFPSRLRARTPGD
jgi:hypothetical protein